MSETQAIEKPIKPEVLTPLDEQEAATAQRPDGDEGDDDEFVDPLEPLAILNEEINEGPACIKERVKLTAKQIKDELATLVQRAKAEAADDAVRALMLAVSDAVTFILDEQSETVVSALAALSQATTENVAMLRDWGENEVEPVLYRLTDGEVGSPGDSMLASEDAAAFRALLEQYKGLLLSIMQADPSKQEMVQEASSQVDAALARIADIEQSEDE